MSGAEDQVATVEATPVVEGPVEIFVTGQTPPVVEEVVEAKEVKAEPAGSEEPPADGEPAKRDDKGRFKGGVQERIDELTRSRREAEREAEYWRIRAQGGDKQQAAANQPKAPTLDQFATPEEYQEAKIEYTIEQRVNNKIAELEAKSTQMKEATTKATSWESKMESARAEIPDFDEVMTNADMPVAGHVAEAIMEHDHGAKLVHHLAKNPDVLEKLNSMSAVKAALEVGRLATKFDSAPDPQPSKPAGKAVSSAPPPARTIGSGRATEESLENMSMDDYVKARKNQGASWAR